MKLHFTNSFARAVLAGAALSAVAACNGGPGGGLATIPPKGNPGPTVSTATRFVGVGDSLTAGVQSGALLGKVIAPNPIAGAPNFSPFPAVPPTQGNGFWALIWSQYNPGKNVLDPTVSPLPLTNAPIGNMVLPAATGAPTQIYPPCTQGNALSYSSATAMQTRLNPNVTPFDVGVPGQLLHEALTQIAPLTACNDQYNASNPNALQSSLFDAESAPFYPVLLNFGLGTTQIAAAVSLRPAVTTVWLGSNDLLKFTFSGGQFPVTTPQSFYSDTVSVISQLQAAGSKVAVANLLDVLHAAYFASNTSLQQLVYGSVLQSTGSVAIATGAATSYGAQATALGLVPGAYFTLSGQLHTLQAVALSLPLTKTFVASTDLIPAAFAAQVQALNDSYNVQIANAAAATGATLVDVRSAYAGIYSGATPVVMPGGKCCSTIYGGGLFSTDGIHPSNTGYAVVANVFIGALNSGLGQGLSPVNVAGIYATDPYAPH